MPNLIFGIISILAILSTALILLRKRLRSISQIQKRETKSVMALAIIFAAMSVYLHFDNYPSNQFLTNYWIGTPQPPVINIELFKVEIDVFNPSYFE